MSFWKLDFRLAKMSIREGHKTRHRRILSRLMSALGHKRTFAVQYVMSALHPKADMCSALAHVRFVPIADITPLHSTTTSRWRAVEDEF